MRARALLATFGIAATLTVGACSSDDAPGSRASAEPRRSTTLPATTLTPTSTTVALPADAPLVAMLGDSNTYFAIPTLEQRFRDAGFRSTIRGISASGLKDLDAHWAPAAAAIAAAPPAAVVVALGTNDANGALTATELRARIDRLLAAMGDVPVVWVTHTEGGEAHSAAAERTVNDEIRAAADRFANLTVLDLAPDLARHREYLGEDGLHFTPEGEEWFAGRIVEAVKTASGAGP